MFSRQNWDYICNRKRRFDEINNSIDRIRAEVILNDFVLRTELQDRNYSVYDPELMAVELYKERLEALVYSSRSQLWRLQSQNNSRAINDNYYQYDYDSRNPKRQRFNNYTVGYSYNNNQVCQTRPNNKKRRNKRKPKRAAIAAPPSSLVQSRLCITNTTTSNTTGNRISASQTSASTTMVFTGQSKAVIPLSLPNAVVAPSKKTKKAKQQTTMNPVDEWWRDITDIDNRLQVNNKNSNGTRGIPSLLSLDTSHVKLNFSPSDRITIKKRNQSFGMINSETTKFSRVKQEIKTECMPVDDDAMVDDLADHL